MFRLTKRDLYWYIGFIIGAIAASIILAQMHVTGGIIRLIIIVIAGIGCAFLGEMMFNKEKAP